MAALPLPLMPKHCWASSGSDIVPPPADAKDAHPWVAASHERRPKGGRCEGPTRDHPAARGGTAREEAVRDVPRRTWVCEKG